MNEPKPHELNGDDDELLKVTAGTYSRQYLAWHTRTHGQLPPEIEETLVDATDRVLQEAARIRGERSSR
ncbi:hypothetical protein [Streptomyces sp. NPDC088752]|uniref:hypothetical protein n=1 Tax=Streptomyces sp. NPDC088752 TaxID=3154963 RepID=UPI0034438DCF